MKNLGTRTQKNAQSWCSGADSQNSNTLLLNSGPKWNDAGAEWRAGEIYKDLSPEAMIELESLAIPLCCADTKVLFTEEQEPRCLLFLLEGRVKLTMNSNEGMRMRG